MHCSMHTHVQINTVHVATQGGRLVYRYFSSVAGVSGIIAAAAAR